METLYASRRRQRKTPRTPPESYARAIKSALKKAGIPTNSATRLRKEFGLDVARVILGHASPAVTEVYAGVDRENALSVMGQVG